MIDEGEMCQKADFQVMEPSEQTGIPLFTKQNESLNLNRMLLMNNPLLCMIPPAWKISLTRRNFYGE